MDISIKKIGSGAKDHSPFLYVINIENYIKKCFFTSKKPIKTV